MKNTIYGTTVASKTNGFAKACVAACKKLLAGIETAKAAVIEEFRGAVQGREHLLELAVNEAEALAWQTEFPSLFFPTLAEEKAHAVARWAQHQRYVQAAR